MTNTPESSMALSTSPQSSTVLVSLTPEDLLAKRLREIDQWIEHRLKEIDVAERSLSEKVGQDVGHGVTEAMRATARDAAQDQRISAQHTYDNALVIAKIDDDAMRESAFGD